jgi:hypothetical protein
MAAMNVLLLAAVVADNSRPWPDYVNAVSTLVIALFTIGLFFGVFTQIGTDRHIERAWVMADLVCGPNMGLLLGDGTDGSNTSVSPIEIRCSNEGRSPAWITEKHLRLEIVDKDKLSSKPYIGPDTLVQNEPEPIAPGKPSTWSGSITGKGHHSLDTMTVVYGVVKYRDIFGKNRETWFAYRVVGYKTNRQLVRLANYPQYNKHT